MKKYLIALSALAFATTSCYEKLNIAPPNAITNEMIQEMLRTATEDETRTILGAISDGLKPNMYGGGYNTRYSGATDGTWSGQWALRLLSGNDIALGYLSAPQGNDYYGCANLNGADKMDVLSYWHRAFTLTNAANKVAVLMNEDLIAANPTNNVLKQYYGNVLALRAFGYLYAMENFGTNSLGMPIYDTYSFSQPQKDRAPAKETYDSIIRWASRADELFQTAGVGFTAQDNSDFTRGLTCYIIARASLLAADSEGATASTYLTQAIAACDKMINSGATLMTEDQYVQKESEPYVEGGVEYPVYKAETNGFMNFDINPEALYGFGWQYGGGGTLFSYGNFLTSSCRIDDRLYLKIDNNDYRKDNFHPEGGQTFTSPGNESFIDGGTLLEVDTYWNTKFANNVGLESNAGPANVVNRNRGDFSFVRLSEAILMKAEAQARQGDDGGAKTTLNTLLAARTRTGATPLTCDTYSSMSGLSALEMVQLQTRIEMWGEKGLEWYNNRRWNIAVNRAGSTVHWNPSTTYPVSGMTLKIPSEELTGSPGMVQNP